MPKKRKLFTKAWSLEGCCLPRREAMRSGQKEGPGSLDEIELTCVESDPERIAFALSGIVTNHREQHLLLFSGGFKVVGPDNFRVAGVCSQQDGTSHPFSPWFVAGLVHILEQ